MSGGRFARFLVVVAWAAASVGCSGAPGISSVDAGGDTFAPAADAGGPTVVCDPAPEVIDPTAIVDDMEDRNGQLSGNAGLNGSWWTAADDTPGGTLEPRSPIPEAIPGGRCGSLYAMRVTGQGFQEWGSLIGMSLAYGPGANGQYTTAPYDAHIRQGIRFWARIGDTSTNQVQFTIGDKHSSPEGSGCVIGGTPPCFTYQVQLSRLDTSWKQYQIPFAALVHQTPGMPNEPIDTTALYTMTFFFNASAVFDLWVDDIEFY